MSDDIDAVLGGLDELKEATELSRALEKYNQAQQEIKQLHRELDESRKQVETERQQRITVEKNICALYKTAKAEVSRKDTLIKELRAKVAGQSS